jgi:hypothetical protein
MARTFTSSRGMSLVEATIILFVLMLLTGVLAPSIGDFVFDAKMVKVKEDCEAIGISIMRLVGDVGPCLKKAGGETGCVEALYGPGTPGGFDWPAEGGLLAEHLVTNLRGGWEQLYALPAWRGAYLTEISSDPWGGRYGVNTLALGEPPVVLSQTRGTAAATTAKGTKDPLCIYGENKDRDVLCISGGANKSYETTYWGGDAGGTTRGGDDFIYVIQGSQHSAFDIH